MPTDTRETYIVDYDISVEASSRRRFYRHIKTWLRDHTGAADTNWSTQSVIITDNREFADFVYTEASQVGRAHMYEAKWIK